MEAQAPYSVFPILNCGPDWLTVTSKRRGVSNDLQDWAYAHLEKQNATDGQVSVAKRLGYVGHSTLGLFAGCNNTHVMVQLSGPRCAPLAPQAIRFSSNVSRLDLQVTVWTEGEQPHLGAWTYKAMVSAQPVCGRPRRLGLIVGHPDGETMTVGRRVSDSYGRLYDKTAEANLGAPRLLWRYEVEWKRKEARRVAMLLEEGQFRPTHACKLVHAWYTKRGVQPSFSPPDADNASQHAIAGPTRDVLAWFRSSVSVTIRRAMNDHGREVVLDALGLSNQIGGGPSG